MDPITITSFANNLHRDPVAELWATIFGYPTAHNDPHLAIDRKLAVNDGLFFVALSGSSVVGTILAGYDGHRGWLYSLAVAPAFRGRGIGTQLVQHAEAALAHLGCLKINLQILPANEAITAFYTRLGYAVEPRISLGKVLPTDLPPS